MYRERIWPIMLTISLICLIVSFISEVTVYTIALAILDVILLWGWTIFSE